MPPARSNAARSVPPRSSARAGAARTGTARSASAARAPKLEFQPRKVKHRGPLSRVRWDRASRVTMIVVLLIIAVLWISGIASLLTSHAQAERGLSQVHKLAAQNKALVAEQKSLHQRATILSKARSLGMVKKGEQSFIVTH